MPKTYSRSLTLIIVLLLLKCSFGLDNFNIEKVNSTLLSTTPRDYKVVGDFVYCVDEYGLSAWDLSNAENPVKVGQCATSGTAMRLEISGDFAYIYMGGGKIGIIDVSDPENPEVVREFTLNYAGYFYPDLLVHDGLLYICAGGRGFYVASLNDPSQPEVISHFQFNQVRITVNILISGNIAYLLNTTEMVVLNIEDPENIEVINTIDDAGGVDIKLVDDMLVVNSSNWIMRYLLDDPETPELISRFQLRNNDIHSIIIEDNVMYQTNDNAFNIYQIIDNNNIELRSRIRVSPESEINLIFRHSDYIYAGIYRQGLRVINVDDPDEPVWVNEPLAEHTITGFYISENTMYLKDEFYGLRIFDISNPPEPESIGTCSLEGEFRNSAFDNNSTIIYNYDGYCYMDSHYGLYIININDPGDPTFEHLWRYRGLIQFAYRFNQFYSFFGALYEPQDRYKNIMVFDFSDPLQPERVFMANDLNNYNNATKNTWQKDNLIFQLQYDVEDMIVYNMDNPRRPELLGHWPEGNYGRFFIYEDYAYCFNNHDIYMYSIENPLEPELFNVGEFEPFVYDIVLDQNVAYVVCGSEGIYCLSLDNPVIPEIVGFYDTPGTADDLLVHDGFIYVADSYELGIYQLNYEPGQDADFTISLDDGWNLVSSPFDPEDNDIENIFARLAGRGNLFQVKDYNGRFYLPAHDFNNIPIWDVNQGYQIKMTESDRLWIYGEEVEANRSIPLPESWSMVSYFPEQEIVAPEAFANIAEQLLFAKDGDGHFYSPEFNFNNIPPLHRGAGYQVKVSEEVELIWNIEGEGLASAKFEDLPRSHFIQVISTDKNMSIIITGLLDEGEIGAFTTSGICIGATAFRNQDQVGLAVWGDDESSDELDGLKEGEAFTLKLWSSTLGAEFDLESENILTGYTGLSGSGFVYETDGFTFFAAKALPSIPDQYYLSQNYPNPFNNVTRLTYGMPETDDISIQVFDLAGRLVTTLVNGNVNAGNHVTVWDASSASTGIYLIKMETSSGFCAVRKIMLVK